MKITDGEGIDVVLNSLVGEALLRSLQLLRKGGRFLEIGKMDLLDASRLKAFPGIEYHTIALDLLSAEAPEQVGGMLSDLMAEFCEGKLAPLPWHGFPLDRALEAFRFMQQARHVGKIVLTQQEAAGRPIKVRGDGTYLITGGTGGLGLHVAEHLARTGAGTVALLSRRAPSEDVRARIGAIEAGGAQVICLQADVADRDGLVRALAKLDGIAPPLRGVIHAAGVLDDGIISQQDAARFSTVMAPKVQGAWNLHALTLNKPVELFAMFSSASAVLGAAGQSNYAAANCYLDMLAHYRQARGLAATSIDWGPWSGAGMAAELDGAGAWALRGIEPIAPDEGMQMFERILGAAPAQIMALPIDWQQFLSQIPPGGDIPLLADVVTRGDGHANATEDGDMSGRLQAELEQLPAGARRERLQEIVEQHLLRVLGMSAGARIAPLQPLNDIGVDLLMAVELRNALARSVGQALPATLLFDYPTVAALTGYLADDVLGLEAADTKDEAKDGEAEAVIGLTAEELEASLEDELRRVGF